MNEELRHRFEEFRQAFYAAHPESGHLIHNEEVRAAEAELYELTHMIIEQQDSIEGRVRRLDAIRHLDEVYITAGAEMLLDMYFVYASYQDFGGHRLSERPETGASPRTQDVTTAGISDEGNRANENNVKLYSLATLTEEAGRMMVEACRDLDNRSEMRQHNQAERWCNEIRGLLNADAITGVNTRRLCRLTLKVLQYCEANRWKITNTEVTEAIRDARERETASSLREDQRFSRIFSDVENSGPAR